MESKILQTKKEEQTVREGNKEYRQIQITKKISHNSNIEYATMKMNYDLDNQLTKVTFNLDSSNRGVNWLVTKNLYEASYYIEEEQKKIQEHSISYQCSDPIKFEQYELKNNVIISKIIDGTKPSPTIEYIEKEQGELYPDAFRTQVLAKEHIKYFCDKEFMSESSIKTIETILDIIFEIYPELELDLRNIGYYGTIYDEVKKYNETINHQGVVKVKK